MGGRSAGHVGDIGGAAVGGTTGIVVDASAGGTTGLVAGGVVGGRGVGPVDHCGGGVDGSHIAWLASGGGGAVGGLGVCHVNLGGVDGGHIAWPAGGGAVHGLAGLVDHIAWPAGGTSVHAVHGGVASGVHDASAHDHVNMGHAADDTGAVIAGTAWCGGAADDGDARGADRGSCFGLWLARHLNVAWLHNPRSWLTDCLAYS